MDAASERGILQDLVAQGEERRAERSNREPITVLDCYAHPSMINGIVQGVDAQYSARITLTPRGHHCECPDSQRRGRQVGPCKHTLALATHRLEELQSGEPKPPSVDWQEGPPTTPGYYWIVQWSHGWFGPAVAYVYDGYPDGLQPPSSFTLFDPEYKEWAKKTEGLGIFLRVRFVQGLGAGDHELRSIDVTKHLPLSIPSLPEK